MDFNLIIANIEMANLFDSHEFKGHAFSYIDWFKIIGCFEFATSSH